VNWSECILFSFFENFRNNKKGMVVRDNVHKKNFVYVDKTRGVLWIVLYTTKKHKKYKKQKTSIGGSYWVSKGGARHRHTSHTASHTIPQPKVLRKNIFWCISSFRPDLLPHMVPGKKYPLDNIIFDTQNLSNGKKIRVPNRITVSGKVFQNVT
jgi:hypothetical protein